MNFGLSFSLLVLTIVCGFLETASNADFLSRSKSEAKAANSIGFRISSSFVAPLEMTIGTWKSFAVAASFRRDERSLILAAPSVVSNGLISISSDASALEASSASAMSKNLR